MESAHSKISGSADSRTRGWQHKFPFWLLHFLRKLFTLRYTATTPCVYVALYSPYESIPSRPFGYDQV